MKAALNDKLEIINGLQTEKEADKKQINELEIKVQNLELELNSRKHIFDMKRESIVNETVDELKSCQLCVFKCLKRDLF